MRQWNLASELLITDITTPLEKGRCVLQCKKPWQEPGAYLLCEPELDSCLRNFLSDTSFFLHSLHGGLAKAISDAYSQSKNLSSRSYTVAEWIYVSNGAYARLCTAPFLLSSKRRSREVVNTHTRGVLMDFLAKPDGSLVSFTPVAKFSLGPSFQAGT